MQIGVVGADDTRVSVCVGGEVILKIMTMSQKFGEFRQLVVTEDHEIFGNGIGDVLQHVVKPAERMARVCEKFSMPLTIFFEVEEYLAFERERKALVGAWGYDPAAALRNQAIELIQRGHDIQLHLHPEWVGSIFRNGRWTLRPEHPTVDSLYDSQREVNEYIATRKEVIDGFYRSAGSGRRVTAYRCGGFCAQPGRLLLRALVRSGITIDSSVVREMVRVGDGGDLDYSSAPRGRRHWQVREDVVSEDPNGEVTEIPIYSRIGRRLDQLTPQRMMAKFFGNIPVEKQREMVRRLGMGNSPVSVVRFLLRKFPIKLDFHNMSSGQMLRWIHAAPAPISNDLDVMVLIGHSKEHRSDANLAKFLGLVALDPMLRVVSMSEIANQLKVMSRVPMVVE